MSGGYDLAKEYIRKCYEEGALDLGDYERLKGFCQIFAGEMEPVIEINFALQSWLDHKRARQLMKVAKVSQRTIDEADAWLGSVRR